MPANVPVFGTIPKHAVLINVNEKNIPNENPAKEKEYNSISVNLQVKVAHVLPKKSVKYNVRVIFHRYILADFFTQTFIRFLRIFRTFFIAEFL